MTAVLQAVHAIERNPRQFPIDLPNIRKANIARFPYAVWYVLGDDESALIGSQIISARATGDIPLFPGSLPGVIGVESDASLPRNEIRYSDHLAFAAPFPRPIPGVPREKNLQGISFSVANV